MPLLLNNNCSTCEFQSHCLAEAKKQDNLTLLNRMTGKAVKTICPQGNLHGKPAFLHIPSETAIEAGEDSRSSPQFRVTGTGDPRPKDLHPHSTGTTASRDPHLYRYGGGSRRLICLSNWASCPARGPRAIVLILGGQPRGGDKSV